MALLLSRLILTKGDRTAFYLSRDVPLHLLYQVGSFWCATCNQKILINCAVWDVCVACVCISWHKCFDSVSTDFLNFCGLVAKILESRTQLYFMTHNLVHVLCMCMCKYYFNNNKELESALERRWWSTWNCDEVFNGPPSSSGKVLHGDHIHILRWWMWSKVSGYVSFWSFVEVAIKTTTTWRSIFHLQLQDGAHSRCIYNFLRCSIKNICSWSVFVAGIYRSA